MAKERQTGPAGPRIELLDYELKEEQPNLAVYLEDKSGKPSKPIPIEANNIQISEKQLGDAAIVRIGPANADEAMLKQLPAYRRQDFLDLIKSGAEILLPKRDWSRWLPIRSCVQGSVSHCRPFPWIIQDLALQALPLAEIGGQLGIGLQTFPKPHFPRRCYKVCDGVVEVYRRVCCHTPWIIDDPRIPEIIIDLDDLIPWPWPKPWPPPPICPGPLCPEPIPWIKPDQIFKEGALDERALYAMRDRTALQRLSKFEQSAYIESRPYLWRKQCNPAVKVGSGPIRPDGTFNICWRGPIDFLPVNCHYEYAYIVKQVINGVSTIIYNGIAANAWFHTGEDANLVSYSSKAISCGQDPGPELPGENFVLLQDIGAARSFRLKTPDATGWDRVGAPGYNDGLLDPAATIADALGNYKNSNWGGTLALRYKFSDGMKALGAKFYRVSVSAANASGNPTGPRTYLEHGLSWLYYEISGGSINIFSASLGPTVVGGRTNLYAIPYETDRDWQSGQYHGFLDTTQFADGRFLVTLELFDAAGVRVRPNGTTAIEAADRDEAFTFRRWYQEIGPTAPVAFAALTHMFWWDNRAATAQIIDLRHNSSSSTGECQFIEGCSNDTFGIGYRAYHPDPMFVLSHSITWKRGLGGSTGDLTPAAPTRYQNVGQPPALPGASDTDTLQQMLGAHTKCSFATTLTVQVKTTNGSGRLQHLDRHDIAAFALEQKPCLPAFPFPTPAPGVPGPGTP